jgi:hypothetical protein
MPIDAEVEVAASNPAALHFNPESERRARSAGALIELSGRGVRIEMPPLRGLLILAPWQWGIVAFACFRQWLHWGETRSLLLFPDLTVIAVLAVYVLLTFWRKRVVIVNEGEVAIGYSAGSKLFWAKRWPTRAIGEIKMNGENGNLLVRVTGADLKEFRISGDKVVTQSVADILQEALVRSGRTRSGTPA